MNVFVKPGLTEEIQTDVLVIGSGAAALQAARHVDARLQVLVLAKDELREGSTFYAQGGVACVTSPGDSVDSHVQDTLSAGAGLCDPAAVRVLVEEAPAAIRDLARAVDFDRDPSGAWHLGQEGAHSHHRILSAGGDATGRAIEEGLVRLAEERPNIRRLTQARAFHLLAAGGACHGALAWEPAENRFLLVRARATVIATGGYAQLFQESTNPRTSTGDGCVMALLAGARLRDPEFVQFHPTALFIAGAPRFLISEAVRGAGGVLRGTSGRAFMKRHHELADLAPRDVVSRAIVREMIRTRESCVFLDLSHLGPEETARRFPTIQACCQRYGVDVTRQWVPVRPAAHYCMGGVLVDPDGRTGVEGLWACGEAASTGVHGANRLASNSLLEALVFGRRTGLAVSAGIPARPPERLAPETADRRQVVEDLNPADLLSTLKAVMWRSAGVFREREALLSARHRIRQWVVSGMCPLDLSRTWLDFQALAVLGLAVTTLAIERRESRGAHFRTDHPERDDDAFGASSTVDWRGLLERSRE